MNEKLKAVAADLFVAGLSYREALDYFRREFLAAVLTDCGGDQCRAAKAMGVHRNTLGRELRRLGVNGKQLRRDLRARRKAAGKVTITASHRVSA